MHTVKNFKQKYKLHGFGFKSWISCLMHYCKQACFYSLKEFKLEWKSTTDVAFLLNPEHHFKDHLKECIDKAVKQFHPPAVRASFAASCTESIDLSVTTITTALGMPIRPPLVEETAVCTANRRAAPAETEEGTPTCM